MTKFDEIKQQLIEFPKTWLITGVAGFIGSNLLETLLKLNQNVIGLDNFSTGHKRNLDEVQSLVTANQWDKFTFFEGDICDYSTCESALEGVNYVLHQAALGSVPRSIANPIMTNSANISGFINILTAAKEAKVESFTYAASSSTYGDHPALPKVEENIGNPLSPYAVTKYVNELYANVFARTYGFKSIGLRYFNVFGPRQDPQGAYAAVIPKWINAMIQGHDVIINGDGKTSRDFCFIDNTVQMNILSAVSPESSRDNIYNVAVGDRTTLEELASIIKKALESHNYKVNSEITYREFRVGDVRHSQADISKAKDKLSYEPSYRIVNGINNTVKWYLEHYKNEPV